MAKGIDVLITAGSGGTPVTYALSRQINGGGYSVIDASIAYTGATQTYSDTGPGGTGFADADDVDYTCTATNADGTSSASSVATLVISSSAEYVVLTDVNTTLSANQTYTAGTPGRFTTTVTTYEQGVINSQYTGAFDLKLALYTTYGKAFSIIFDNNNTLTDNSWGLFRLCVKEDYEGSTAAGIVAATVALDVPTTFVANATNYLRFVRVGAAASSDILVYYYDSSTETLVHTFTADANATYIKFIMSTGRRIHDMQIK